MTACVVEKNVGIWDQRKEVENDGKYDGVCEECCDADREISQHSLLVSYEELNKDVPYHPKYLRYIYIQGIIEAVKEAEMGHDI